MRSPVVLIECPACERGVSQAAAACPACGHPVRQDMAAGRVTRRVEGGPAAASDTLSLWAMICGVAGLGLVCTIDTISVLGLIPSLLAVPLGITALGRVNRGEASGRGLAWAGLIAGVIATLLYVVALIAFVMILLNDAEIGF